MPVKLLSVIIPAFNVGDYIVEFIDSLLSQIPSPNEIIIVNEGSTDNTLALIDTKYGAHDNVRIVTITNGGIENARDVGIVMAQGDFIFCCYPEDIVCDGLFRELSETIALHPQVELFCFNSQMFEDENSGRTYGKVKHREFGLMHSQDVFASLLRSGVYSSATCNYIVKKEVIGNFQLKYVERLHEDDCFTLNAFLRARSAFVSQNTYYKQRIRSGSLTNSVKSESFLRQRYEAFIFSYEKLLRVEDVQHELVEVRRLYLIHSFRLMIQQALADNRSAPPYVMHAINYLGKSLKPGSMANWLLLSNPELYTNLIRVRQTLCGIKTF